MLLLWTLLIFITVVAAESPPTATPPAPTQTLDSSGISNVLKEVFKDYKDFAPTDCKPIPGGSVVYSCNNNSKPLLDIHFLTIDPYPMVPGLITFSMTYDLHKDIPEGTFLSLTSFSDEGPIFDGVLDFCGYSPFAKVFCPVNATHEPLEMTQILEVPDDVPPGTYSFFLSARNPQGEVYVNLGANIELQNDNKVHGDDL